MQERMERWLGYWIAKPISWSIYGIWLALKYGWRGVAWSVNRCRERWKAWRAKRQIDDKSIVHTERPTAVPAKRASRREVARKE
jgi:hypothetical protein